MSRYYLVPAGKNGGLVQPSEVPHGWGLLWCDCLKVTVKKASMRFLRDAERELQLLLTVLMAKDFGFLDMGLDPECLPDVHI